METGILLTYGLLFVSLFFEVFLLVSFLESRSARKKAVVANESALPKVAIVVPCFNEERGIAATLRSLLALRYPAEKLEVIVVDDGSDDATHAAALAFAHEPRIRIFKKRNGGKHTAMNFALQKTDAEFIGCLDADSVVEPGALRHIIPAFGDARVAAVTPGIHAQTPETLLQHMQKVEYRLSIFNRFMLSLLGAAFITPGPFSIFRASTIRELGGWRHGHSTEDMEMALRIQDAGLLIANAPGAVVYTTTPRSLRGLFRQRVRWTYGFLRNTSDYRYMLANRAYGNLGVLVLPLALISIGTGIYFFVRTLWYGAVSVLEMIGRVQITGALPAPHMDVFYFNTSALLILVWCSVALILLLICMGSFIGTGSRKPPMATPLFLLFYSFLAPLWLGAAVVRAVLRTGVSWR